MIKKSFIFCSLFIFIYFAISVLSIVSADSKKIGHLGNFEKWRNIEISMKGPESKALEEPNPFAIIVDVDFISNSGRKFRVPAFFDGDGKGEPDGNIWRVRFSADEIGVWHFRSDSSNSLLDGYKGTFIIEDQKDDAPGFYKWGRIEYVGTNENKIRYLKFRDGPYWLKAGCDSPENFLGSFRNYNNWKKRKIALDYLSDKGINSLYIMTHNIDGDDNDVWPWIGDTSESAKLNAGGNARFNIAKLKEWRELFEYMQSKGVVPYIVLEDDSAWTGYDHWRYYREIIARFGDLPALIFNINEEHDENYGLKRALSLAKMLQDIDPYNHPRGIHNINFPEKRYILSSQVDFASIQTKKADPLIHNKIATKWIDLCRRLKKRILMVGFDEPRPELDRRGWWSAYMGGAVWEILVTEPYDRPMETWGNAWEELGGTRAFMETLPFWEMEPKNDLVTSGKAFCLANEGEAYALYLPFGGEITVKLIKGVTYDYAWWNPSNDKNGKFENEGQVTGGSKVFTSPGAGDWALRILKTDS